MYFGSFCFSGELCFLNFKDLPMCLSDKNILDFIDTQPGLIAKSGVIPGRLRDSAGRRTPFLSGERLGM